MDEPIICRDCDGEVDPEWYWAKRNQAGRRCETCGPVYWRARNAEYHRNNPEKRAEINNRRRPQRLEYLKSWGERNRDQMRLMILSAYSAGDKPECASCGNDELIVLDLDHTNWDGGQHRKEISNGKGGDHFYRALKRQFEETGSWPVNYVMQVLCANCHVRKDRAKLRNGRA